MTRIALTDDSGKWFDEGKAVRFREQTRSDGSNRISVITGSQWDHEAVYYTASGNWIRNAWSQRQGSPETYCEIDEDEAIKWLIANECWDDDEIASLPEDVRDRVNAGIAAAEL